MTDASITAAEPDGAPRIASLDVLRGIAILGILFLNVDGMGVNLLTEFQPRLAGWTPLDQIAWSVREVLVTGTARAMLEMLFGAGMVILTERAAAGAGRRWQVLSGYYRRNLVLFCFGLVHIFVLGWFGDILHTYGIAAMIAFSLRRWRPRWLLVPGLSFAAFLAVTGAIGLYQDARQASLIAGAQASRAAGRALTADQRKALSVQGEEKAEKARLMTEGARFERARRGGRVEWLMAESRVYLFLLALGYPLFWIWEATATMLVGIALFRWGVLQGQRDRGFYWRLLAGGYLIGLVLRAGNAGTMLAAGGAGASGLGLEEFARLATTLGHVAFVHLALGTVRGRRLLSPFVAAGRTALSLYVCQTLIVFWGVFSPFGLHLYGRLSWASLMAVALAVDVVLLLAANAWVRRFQTAPVEWAWRSMIAGRRLPFRGRPAAMEAMTVPTS